MLYLDRKQISLEKVKSVLKDNGWKRTRSRRYIRFEKAVDNEGGYIGVEINASDIVIEISSYCHFLLPFSTLDEIDKEMYKYFNDFIISLSY